MKRLILTLFSVCLLSVCLLVLPAKAEAASVASGTCGENATWVLDDTGTLTITGTGRLTSYYDWDYDDAPWYDLRSSIVKIVVHEGITHIGYRCFADCSALETVELPQSLEVIGGGAFSGCGFKGITLPQGLVSIEGSAFDSCTSLEAIVIPDSVESVYVNSFFDCTALKEVTIGTGVTMLGPQVFKNCTALEKVYYNAVNVKDLALYHDTFYNAGANGPGITMVIGKDVLRIPGALTHSREEANVTALVFEEGSVCTSIGWESFNGTNIQELEFPSSMETVESSAFSSCSSLVRVRIPDNVKKVEYMAFWNCDSLQQVTVGKGLELGIPGAFPNCTELKSVHVDAQNATYYSDAEGVVFSKDRKTLVFLPQGYGSEYTVPDFVKTIGESSISGNPNLTKLTIPGNVEKIAISSIGSCNALTTVELSEGLVSIGVNAFSGNQKLTGITIPDSVVTVGDFAFDMCDSLSSVYIGKGVTTLGESVFGIYGIQNSIGVHPENRYYCSDNGALYDKNKTTLITVVRNTAGSFEVTQGVKTIEANCFYGCEEITQIILPDSVTKIENNAFNGCVALTEIELPEGLESLEGAAFVECRKLVQMRIPDGVESIGGSLFHGCESLETVTFGTGIKRIWDDMFYGCTSLETMIFTGNAPQIDNYAFSGLVAMAYYPGADSSWTTDKLQGYDGSITWVPVLEQVDDLRLTTPSVLTGYIVGDKLNPAQIGVEVLFGGKWLQIPYKVLQISSCDMTTAGRKTVTVSYGGKSATVTVLVHEKTSMYVDPALYPESDHNYSNYCSDSKTLTVPGASRLILTFSTQTAFERGYDKLRVMDGDYSLVAEYTGTEAAGVTLIVQGDTVILYLSSDGSSTYYGYSFTNISAETVNHTGSPAADLDATCTEAGYSGAVLCDICQQPAGGQTIPAVGHAYTEAVVLPVPGKQGYTTHTCSRCGDIYVDGYTDFEAVSGECGQNAQWKLDEEGVLRITGSGPMYDYKNPATRSGAAAAPWSIYSDGIIGIVVEGGITRIGSFAFCNCDYVTEAVIGTDVEDVGAAAFANCEALQEITFTGSAPAIADDAFNHVYAVVVYPSNDSSWAEVAEQNYAGVLTWGTDAGQVAVMGDAVYSSFAEALEAYNGSTYLKLMTDVQVDAMISRDLYIDLNGYNLSGTVITGGYRIYGMDSTTDNYTCEAIGYMNLVDENGNEIVPVSHFKSDITGTTKRYMAIKDENGYSFHRFYLGITHMSVRPTTTGVGYKGVFYGDRMVAANLGSFGFTLQLVGNAPITATLDAENFVSGKVFTLRIDNFDVEGYGETALLACATLQLADGTVIQSTAASMTMRSLMEQLNTAADTLTQAQLTAIKALIEKHVIIKSWNTANLY